MKRTKKEYFTWAVLSCLLASVIYITGYLFTVKRTVVLESMTPEQKHWTVIAELGSKFSHALFGPALNLDRHAFRRYYWSDWLEIRTATGETNIVYFVDAK